MSQTDIASYADDNAPYVLGDSINDVIKSLEDDSVKWFLANQMKVNSIKFYLITNKQSYKNLKIGTVNIESSAYL